MPGRAQEEPERVRPVVAPIGPKRASSVPALDGSLTDKGSREPQIFNFSSGERPVVQTTASPPKETAPQSPPRPPRDTSPSEDEEDSILDETDFAQNAIKYDARKARLESDRVDLSARGLRAKSPLERLSMLLSLTAKDLPSPPTPDAGLDLGKEVDDDGDHTILTPDGEYTDEASMRDADEEQELSSGRSTPDFSRLPYLVKAPPTPVSDPDQGGNALQKPFDPRVVAFIQKIHDDQQETDQSFRDRYRDAYFTWRRHVQDFEKVREENEKEKPRKSLEPAPTASIVDNQSAPLTTPVGGRRGHNFSSEYDLEKAMEESRRTAQEEAAKRDQEALRAKADLEREANIKPMLPAAQRKMGTIEDTTRLRQSSHSVMVFEYEPPPDDFTQEEHKVLVENYQQFPKKWGKIAQALPGRSYKDCIFHYYATKWRREFKAPKTKGRRGGRVGKKGGAAPARGKSNALMSDLGVKPEVYTGNEVGQSLVTTTESGRPRRAAAPVFGDKEEDADSTEAAATRKPAATARGDGGEATVEKTGKRGRAATKEKAGKKHKTQPLAARPAAFPVRTAKDKGGSPMPEGDAAMYARSGEHNLTEEQRVVAGFNAQVNPDLGMAPPEKVSQPEVRATLERPKSHGQSQSRAAGPSSYWSVEERNEFRRDLAYFGHDFAAIAEHMGTKTTTMVSRKILSTFVRISHSLLDKFLCIHVRIP